MQVCRDDLLQKSALDIESCTAGDLEDICSVQINDLYMFMGRELEALDEIPAGNILGIYVSCSLPIQISHYIGHISHCYSAESSSLCFVIL